MKTTKQFFLALFLLSLPGFAKVSAQCAACGSGWEGAFNATSNTTIAGGVHNFTTFNIDPGVTVRVTGSQPLEIYATGAVSIGGTLDVSGLNGADGVTYTQAGAGAIGVAGGGNGGDGSYSVSLGPLDGISGSGSGPGAFGSGWSGGGGAGYAAVGGSSGGVGGAGGPMYGVAQLTGNTAGSGGGGGSGGYQCGAGGGGAGGGFVAVVSCVSITVSGTITANGGNGGSDGTGNCGGGGGGSGGSIWLSSPSVVNNGSLTANGGTGGASTIPGSPYYGVGANGSVGRIRIDASTISGSGTVNPATGFSGTFGNSPVIDTIIGTDVSCFGMSDGSATASVTGGSGTLTYSWSPTPGSSANLSNLPAGCYTLVVTDSVGCIDSNMVCINQPTALALSFINTELPCNGDCSGTVTAQVSGGTPNYFYSWSNGAISNPITNICAGFLSVTVTDNNLCTITGTFVLTEPPAIVLSETHLDATFGNSDGSGTVNASGGTPPFTYFWSPTGDTTSSASNLAPGTYSVLVTDSNGCTDSIDVVIGELVGAQDPSGLMVNIYPNPSSGMVNISLVQEYASEIKLQLSDAQGKLVLVQSLGSNKEMMTALDLSSMKKGLYLCQIETSGGVVSRMITLQ